MYIKDIFPGMRVRIRQWDDMAEEFGYDEHASIQARFGFPKRMLYLCGQEFEVEKCDGESVLLVNHPKRDINELFFDAPWSISADMLEEAEGSANQDVKVDDLFRIIGL